MECTLTPRIDFDESLLYYTFAKMGQSSPIIGITTDTYIKEFNQEKLGY
jgi:hypothetical protein